MTEDERPLAMEDLGRLIRKRKWPIIATAAGFGLLALFYAASRPIVYQAEATFREKGTNSGIPSGTSLVNALAASLGTSGGDQDVAVLLKSRVMMEALISKFGLQASVSELPKRVGFLNNFSRNVIAEWAHFKNAKTPPLPDQQEPLAVKNVIYEGEVPLSLKVTFTTSDGFIVTSEKGVEVGMGTLNDSFVTGSYAFTLTSTAKKDLAGRTFALGFSPLPVVAKGLSNALKVKADEASDKVLHITFSHPNRQISSAFVNGLMDAYQDYLRSMSDKYAGAQLEYLHKRQAGSAHVLQTFLADYAAGVKKQLNDSGIFDTERELEYLLRTRQLTDSAMKKNRLELLRLQGIDPENPAYYQALMGMPDVPQLIGDLIGEINQLKHQRDYLELALQSEPTDRQTATLQEKLSQQIQTLQTLDQNIKQAESLAGALKEDRELPLQSHDAATSPPLIGAWYGKMREAKERLKATRESDKLLTQSEWGNLKNHALGYLQHMIRLSKVQKGTLEERLAHQQSVEQDLQGIDLETASQIYVNLNEQRNVTEASMRQNAFILEQMKDPSFEISSLSYALTDPVGSEIVMSASKAVMSLRDSDNRSEREQERLREELQLQRQFLEAHLVQTNRLLELRDQFLKDKIHTLQESMLELIQQRISVAENHLVDYSTARVEHLKHEQALLAQTQLENQEQMARLPNRWVSEQVLQHRLKLNKALVEEVSKLVESKNIAHHLETIQSAPIDSAVTPVLPKRPWLFLYALLGSIAGAALASAFVVVNGVRKGLEVSGENLTLADQYVAGVIRPPVGKDLKAFFEAPHQMAVLRRLASYLCEERGTLLVLTGGMVDYSGALASLLTREGRRVVKVSLAFDAKATEEELPGLLQVLEGQADSPRIIEGKDFDQIVSGDVSVYGNELVKRPAFSKLLEQLQNRYDWVLLVSPVKADSAEAESLVSKFQRVAISVGDVKLDDLKPITDIAKTDDSRLVWVVVSS